LASHGEETIVGKFARAVGSAAAVRLVPFFAAPMAMTQLAVVSPVCVVLGTLVVSGFLAQFASRADHRRTQSKQRPRPEPTRPLETGALERAYARQAVVETRLEVDEPSGKPVGRAYGGARDGRSR